MARRAAGFLVYRELGQSIQYLLLQASNLKHHWTPPKGHVDPGEDDLTTAYRETLEEAGIPKDQLRVIEECKDALEYEAWGKPKIVTYWLALLKDPHHQTTISDEHQDFKWLEFEEALKFAEFKDMQNTISKFHTFLTSRSTLPTNS